MAHSNSWWMMRRNAKNICVRASWSGPWRMPACCWETSSSYLRVSKPRQVPFNKLRLRLLDFENKSNFFAGISSHCRLTWCYLSNDVPPVFLVPLILLGVVLQEMSFTPISHAIERRLRPRLPLPLGLWRDDSKIIYKKAFFFTLNFARWEYKCFRRGCFGKLLFVDATGKLLVKKFFFFPFVRISQMKPCKRLSRSIIFLQSFRHKIVGN